MRGYIRDDKGNLISVTCMVCGEDVGVAGGQVKGEPFCGRHFREKIKPKLKGNHNEGSRKE